MYRILQYSLVRLIVFSFLMLFILIGCNIENADIETLKNKYSLEDLCNGLEIVNMDIDLLVYPLCDLDNQEIDINKIINKHNYQLIITSSPYLCGGCQRANFKLVNYFTEKYTGKVYMIIENCYIKDTMEDLENVNLDDSLIIFLDNDGKNIQRIKDINNQINSATYIIVDNDNHIRYFCAKSYYYQTSDLQLKKIIGIIEDYLSNT